MTTWIVIQKVLRKKNKVECLHDVQSKEKLELDCHSKSGKAELKMRNSFADQYADELSFVPKSRIRRAKFVFD